MLLTPCCDHMTTFERGNFALSYTGHFPDHLKLVKTVEVFPFELTAIGSLNPRTLSWSYAVGCRDTVIGGKLSYNAEKSAIEYKKVLPLPVFGGFTRPVVSAEWQVGTSWRKPRLQVGFAVDDSSDSSMDDGAVLTPQGTLSFRKKMFVTRAWALETDGDLKVKLQHDLTGSTSALESLGLGLTARELNVVCRI